MSDSPTADQPAPFQLLGHAINHIQDRMAAEDREFSVLVTAELAADDCFRTVLAGFVEDSAYTQHERSPATTTEPGTVALEFSRS